jgi:hypothetical protein
MTKILECFDTYVKTRKLAENARIGLFSTAIANEYRVVFEGELPKIGSDDYDEAVIAIVEEIAAELRKAYGLTGESPARFSATRALYTQAEAVYSDIRAKALQNLPYHRRLAAAVGRRMSQSRDKTGSIDRVLVAPIKLNILSGISNGSVS